MKHIFNLRVYYEDTDMGGIVYHANFLKFIERARSEWVAEMGIDQMQMREDQGVVFVVRRIDAEYFLPARYGEDLRVETSVAQLTGARLIMDQVVTRAQTRLFAAQVTAVCMTLDGKPMRLPPQLQALKRS